MTMGRPDRHDPLVAPLDAQPPAWQLPFSRWWPVFAGAAVGVAMRLLFALGVSPMTTSFILLTPMLVGGVAIAVAERQARRTWGYYAGAGALASMLFVAGTLAILVE